MTALGRTKTVKWFLHTKSFRVKLVLIVVLVEVVMLTLLVANSL